MAYSALGKSNDEVAKDLTSMSAEEQNAIMKNLTKAQRTAITSLLSKVDTSSSSVPEFAPPMEITTPISPSAVTTNKVQVTTVELDEMWGLLDTLDLSVIDPEELKVFEYEGFNPDEVLRSLMKQKKVHNISNAQFLKDIATLCAAAVMKGTINDNNFKKMRPAGQQLFTKLASMYKITKGSAKGKPAEIITVSRIAAAFPGTIINLLQNDKLPARAFPGPMFSEKMDFLMHHQALAACVPRSLEEKSKSFILGAVTAFSVDQTLTITKPKPSIQEAVKNQEMFIKISHSGRYPREDVRSNIFGNYAWGQYYDAMKVSVESVNKNGGSFTVVSKDDFISAVSKV